MEHRSITKSEIKEIKELVNSAITAHSKEVAKPYIRKLKFILSSVAMEIKPTAYNVLGEVISYASEASGQVQQKEHWISCVNSSMYKLEIL